MVCGGAIPPVGKDRNPPALHLAEAGIRELDVQGQLGHPDSHFQGGVEDVVAEGDPGVHGPAGFLSADKHIVTAAGYLGVGGGERTWLTYFALQVILGGKAGEGLHSNLESQPEAHWTEKVPVTGG